MRISMKSDYALRAMMELAAAYGNRSLQTSEIAARRAIPESYLEQLLTTLRKAGFVASSRGPQGGHSLALHPSQVTAGDVVKALDGPVIVLDCLDSSDACQHSNPCVLRELWLEVRGAVEGTLDRITIEELSSRQAVADGGLMYHI
ncbi:MAG: Rrf2 family transcriptional regulator [Chloroflexi bacterium]|nr:Rrf2 family transcriptional regulator [Chloroflexota bacterium]